MEEEYFEDEFEQELVVTEEYIQDADAEYEAWRDREGDKLTEVITDMYNAFVLSKDRGYYKGNKERFVEHTINILTGLTDTHIKVSGKMVSVVANEKDKQNTLTGFSQEQIQRAVADGLLAKERTEEKENEIVQQLQRA